MLMISLTSLAQAFRSLPPSRKLTSVRGYLLAGVTLVFVLFGGIGGWAVATDLAGAVLAQGTVVVSSSVKKIQHPTGGVVGEILVKNGDSVRAHDVLLRLDETVTRANLQLVTAQINELLGRKARLMAERDDAKGVTFPDALLGRKQDASVAQILAGEQTLFEKRVSSRQSQIDQLGERISGLREEIAGTSAQVVAKSKEIELINSELSSLETLEAKQLVTTSKLMALRREAARLDGERAQMRASIGQSKGRVAEIEIQRLSIDSEAKSEIVKELRETEGRLAELFERRTAAEDQLRRIEVRSPVDGIVHQMSVFTVGGVINAAEPVMTIVPKDDRLVIEAKIAPKDIDQARAHQKAVIRLPAFNERTTPTIEGHVSQISADLTRERETGLSYFVARIEISDTELAKLNGLQLVPGMPAEVQIKTDPRTALSYLMRPLQDQFSKAFKER